MDVLRENIGLLQLPYEDEYYYDEEDINEGFLGFGKKKSRWQRFKDAIKRNKGKIAAGALGLGAAWTGNSRYNYNKLKKDFNDPSSIYSFTSPEDESIIMHSVGKDPTKQFLNVLTRKDGSMKWKRGTASLKDWSVFNSYSDSSIDKNPYKYFKFTERR